MNQHDINRRRRHSSSTPLREFRFSFILFRWLFCPILQFKFQLKLWSCRMSKIRCLWRGIWKVIMNKFIVYCNITSCRLVEICNVWTVPRIFLVRVKRSITRTYFSLTTCCLTLKLEALKSLKILVFTRRNVLTYQNTCLQPHRCEHLKNTNILKTKLQVRKNKIVHNVSQTFRTGPCQVHTTERLCVCVCVCVFVCVYCGR